MNHGSRYAWLKAKCRCEACVTAMREQYREYARRRRQQGLEANDPRHGTLTGYRNYGCRCEKCRNADRVYRGWKGVPHGTRTGQNTYMGVHKDLRKDRGPARDHFCPCGARAEEWALKPDAVDIIVDGRGLKFSINQSDYQSMCIPCHREMDFRRSHCKAGHELSGENVRITPKGRRACRACSRERCRVANMKPEMVEHRRRYAREYQRRLREAGAA